MIYIIAWFLVGLFCSFLSLYLYGQYESDTDILDIILHISFSCLGLIMLVVLIIQAIYVNGVFRKVIIKQKNKPRGLYETIESVHKNNR